MPVTPTIEGPLWCVRVGVSLGVRVQCDSKVACLHTHTPCITFTSIASTVWSSPPLPPRPPSIFIIPGAEHVITSDGFFGLEHMPKRVAVVGAGYIAVELAGVLASLGADTSLIIRHESVLRKFEPFLGKSVLQNLEHAGVTVFCNSNTARIDKCVGSCRQRCWWCGGGAVQVRRQVLPVTCF